MQRRELWLFGSGIFLVLYCIVVLGFVTTSPDLRLRCLLVDDAPESGDQRGLLIRQTPGLQFRGNVAPVENDLLFQIAGGNTHTFIEFAHHLTQLRYAEIPAGWEHLHPDFDPLAEGEDVPPIYSEKDNGRRWVEVRFQSEVTGQIERSWLLVQSVPLLEVALTFFWLLCQLGICAVAALAYWHRPFDRSARLFFIMCMVTLGAFVGGYHWWVIAGSLWLTIPFVVCAVLLPSITLHFFLVYPHAIGPMARRPRLTLGLLYVSPLLAIAALLGTIGWMLWFNPGQTIEVWTAHVEGALELLRAEVYIYLAVAATYFVLTLIALVTSLSTARNPIEHHQVKWILRAGLFAAFPVGYSLYLAYADPVGFALGATRLPMFLASLSLMLAYVVAIVRYKLMLVSQVVSKGVLYYAVSGALAVGFGMLIAFGSMLDQLLNVSLSPQQVLAGTAILVLAVVLLLWLRDLVQQEIDRGFFREKYQLDRALQQMNRAVGHLADPEALAGRMLGSCRDVLRVERAAIYLRRGTSGPFQLAATEGMEGLSLDLSPAAEFLDALVQGGGSLQRVTPGTRSEMSPVQNQLRELRADLVHVLEIEGAVEGLVVLGEKRNGTPFTAEDLTFLTALGQITNVALHSARIHQDMVRLNEDLRLKTARLADQKRQIAMLQAELTGGRQATSTPADSPNDFRREAIKGNSPAMQRVLETVRKVAGSESSVLVRGESGTGKELLAQVLHENSPRRSGPMIAVHCASLSSGLLESELFGHVKGSFTGAHRDRVGRFEAASGGTLFLDEIGDISLETQVKLLRVLQERCFEPVGGSRTVHVDVRLITATHQNLEKLIAEGKFREDLYYRLNVISITLPPLRERREDVLELALHFLGRSARRTGKRITHIEEEALTALEQYDWPGNIRELENVIERAVVLAEESRISHGDLPSEVVRPLPRHVLETKPASSERDGPPAVLNGAQRDTNGAVSEPDNPFDSDSERELLEDALRRCGGNKARAARLLGMPRSTYYSKLKKYAIE